jgi:hypothetical protein
VTEGGIESNVKERDGIHCCLLLMLLEVRCESDRGLRLAGRLPLFRFLVCFTKEQHPAQQDHVDSKLHFVTLNTLKVGSKFFSPFANDDCFENCLHHVELDSMRSGPDTQRRSYSKVKLFVAMVVSLRASVKLC